MNFSTLCNFLLCLLEISFCYDNDKVFSLPNITDHEKFRSNFDIYSGYINSGEAGKALHYLLFTSQRNFSDDPLVVWFNGGPGCSSLGGAFQGNGPFVMVNGKFHHNPYAFNTISNVVYLESPENVGFSDVGNAINIQFNDTLSLLSNWIAIQSFYEKFPNFKSRRLFLAGESYASEFILRLGIKIIESKIPKVQLSGLLIGSPKLKNVKKDYFFYKYFVITGLMSPDLFDELLKKCNCSKNIYCEFRKQACINFRKDIDVKSKFYNTLFSKEASINTSFQHLEKYLNREDVQESLHVSNKFWKVCSRKYKWTKNGNEQVDALNKLTNLYEIPVSIYSGKRDSLLNYLSVNQHIETGVQGKSNWKLLYKFSIPVGNVNKYNKHLDHTVLEGAGHGCLTMKPDLVLHLLENLLHR